MKYPNTFLKQCDQCFHSLKGFLKKAKWFENDIFGLKISYKPLPYNIMQLFLNVIRILKF